MNTPIPIYIIAALVGAELSGFAASQAPELTTTTTTTPAPPCKNLGEECLEGSSQCCQSPSFIKKRECRKSDSSSASTCTEVLGILDTCTIHLDAEYRESSQCGSGLFCELKYKKELETLIFPTGVVPEYLKELVCKTAPPPPVSCTYNGNPCTANYDGDKSNCCTPPSSTTKSYCKNDTTVSGGSPAFNGRCAECTFKKLYNCDSDDDCCKEAGGYCKGDGLAERLHRQCEMCAQTGVKCFNSRKCCNPNDKCRGSNYDQHCGP